MAQIITKLEPFIGLPMIASWLSRRYFASKSKSKGAGLLAQSGVVVTKPKKLTKKKIGIIKYHHENKMLFGALLETHIERAKRIKMEGKQDLKKQNEPNSPTANLVLEMDGSDERTFVESLGRSEKSRVAPLNAARVPNGWKLLNLGGESGNGSVIKSKFLESKVQNETSRPRPSTLMAPDLVFTSSLAEPFPPPVSRPFPHTAGADVRLPSVTRILSATMSPEQKAILEKWERKMIKEMGEDRFRQYKEELFSTGKDLHCNIRQLLSGIPEDELLIRDAIEGHWGSLRQVLSQIQQTHILESHVSHPHLQYCGIVDCVAQFRDKLVLIDWKTSEKPKPVVTMTYDTPLQIAAYIGAINEDPNYSLKVKEGLIVIAYKNGQECQTFFLTESDLNVYWKQWIRRLNLYRSQMDDAKAKAAESNHNNSNNNKTQD